MEIIVHVEHELAPPLRGDAAPTTASLELERRLSEIGVELTALFPDLSDDAGELLCHFSGDVPEPLVEEKLEHLRTWSGVTAAYSKPPSALP